MNTPVPEVPSHNNSMESLPSFTPELPALNQELSEPQVPDQPRFGSLSLARSSTRSAGGQCPQRTWWALASPCSLCHLESGSSLKGEVAENAKFLKSIPLTLLERRSWAALMTSQQWGKATNSGISASLLTSTLRMGPEVQKAPG